MGAYIPITSKLNIQEGKQEKDSSKPPLQDEKHERDDKKEYRWLIIHAIIGLVSGTVILIISTDLDVRPEIVFLYILVAESYVILSLILQLAQKTHTVVNDQQKILSGQDGLAGTQRKIQSGQEKIETDVKELIRIAPSRDVDSVRGEKEIFEFIQMNKEKTKDRFYGLWCLDRVEKERFTEYFQYEREMYSRSVNVHRLINTKTVDKSIIREHIKNFSDFISDGRYIITSTTHSEYEMVICFGCLKDVKSSNTLAIQLIPDRTEWKVDLAIYSYYRTYRVTMVRLFELLEKNGKNLKEYWDPNKPDESIDKWFKSSDEICY